MKNKNLIYLALGLGALYFLTKKKDTDTTETTTTTPDVGNDKNDVIDVETDTTVETESGGSATVETQGSSNTNNPVVEFMQTGSSSSLPSGVFTTV